MIRMATLCAAGVLACFVAIPAEPANTTREIHGSADAFAMPGMALAWAVLRAPNEVDTAVVIRIEADPKTYGWIEIVGKDPFTQRERPLQAASALGGPFDLRVPRAQFADFPRTEVRLWQGGSAPGVAPPTLLVYYLGVPDTTPEVLRAPDLDPSLAARIVRARDASPGSPP
jgi:hypothetical protein